MIGMDMIDNILAPGDQRNRFYGLTVGIVTNNQDPDGLGRVKVKFPWLSDQDESHWARVATLMAGNERGLYFLPEVDDEVLVAFEHGVVEFPYVLGALWNGQDVPPESNDDGENNRRTIKSRSGHVIRLDDTDGEEKIEIIDGSGNNSIVIDTAENTVTITADADITIQSNSGKLSLSGNGVEITSQAEIKIEASADADLKASGQVNIQGSMVNIN
jgi:phage baseplate assembly protein V